MEFDLSQARLRPLRAEDAASLAEHANDPVVARDLPDRFPHPYGLGDAHKWLSTVLAEETPHVLAIEVDGACVGTIGWKLRDDVERLTREIGYWIGTAFAGRGITTEAVQAVTPWLVREFGLTRVEARLFQRNRGSARVLEKAGYVREALLRRSAIKDGEVLDQELWAWVTDEPGSLPEEGGAGSPW